MSKVAKKTTVDKVKGATDEELIEKYESRGKVHLKKLLKVAVKAITLVKVSVPLKRSEN
jgi:hypothetical protein